MIAPVFHPKARDSRSEASERVGEEKSFDSKNHVYSELKFRLRKPQKKAFKKLE
jgi:hypothetical protein